MKLPTANIATLLFCVCSAFTAVMFGSVAAHGTDVDPWLDKLTARHVVTDKRFIQITRSQAVTLTAAIDSVVQRYNGRMPKADARVALATIALHESDMAADVISCARLGDGGRAVGAYQQHLSGKKKDHVCERGLPAQTASALYLLEGIVTDPHDFDAMLYRYAGSKKGAAELQQLARELR